MKKTEKPIKFIYSQSEIDKSYLYLLNAFETNKLYLDSSVSLTKLSRSLNTGVHILSLTINTKFGMHFFDLINSKRIWEAQKMLKNSDKKNRTIEGIGFEVGFNSRSAFYRAFKKFTNLTPTEYLNKLK